MIVAHDCKTEPPYSMCIRDFADEFNFSEKFRKVGFLMNVGLMLFISYRSFFDRKMEDR